MTREQELQILIATARKAAEAAMQQGDHKMAITALLSAFVTLAEAHPCCTETAARLAQAVAAELQQHTLARIPPASPQLH